MAGVNRVILVGRLGHDPEVKYLPNGNAVVNFTMATSESWVKDGERQEKTEWHRIVAFGKLAEIIVKYLHKGKEVYIEGKLQTRSWEQDGVKRYTTEIVANQMQMLGSKESNGEQQAAPQPQQNHNQAKASYQPQPQQQAFPQEQLPAGDGDIPF